MGEVFVTRVCHKQLPQGVLWEVRRRLEELEMNEKLKGNKRKFSKQATISDNELRIEGLVTFNNNQTRPNNLTYIQVQCMTLVSRFK